MENKSFTASYSIEAGNWVFFHDYIPNFYFHTRENLYNVYIQDFYKHNKKDSYGQFHLTLGQENPPINSFFIDIVFKTDSDFLLETVNWVSSSLHNKTDAHDRSSEWNTLTHITIWNSQQHTGRISLESVFTDLQYTTSRKTNGAWSMNDFRNILKDRGLQFIEDLFKNYALIPSTAETKPWYDAELIEDKYVVIRFEYDNSLQNQLILHDTSIQAQKTSR
jgi:hypothetical protein